MAVIEPMALNDCWVDLHCHILPGLDDGAKTLDQALAMARLAVDDGIGVICATPHHGNGLYRNPADLIREAVSGLQSALDAEGIPIQVLPGAEHHLVPELPAELASGQAITLADRGEVALVELPTHTIPYGAEIILKQILALGITPLIVHPERNAILAKHPERLTEWIGLGCLAQITAQSCTGQFGPVIQRASQKMLRDGLIHCMASDAHRDRRRIPKLSEGREQIARWFDEDLAERLVDVGPSALIQGQRPS